MDNINDILKLKGYAKKYGYEDGMRNPYTSYCREFLEQYGIEGVKAVLQYWIKEEMSFGLSYSFIYGFFHEISYNIEESEVINLLEDEIQKMNHKSKKDALTQVLLNYKQTEN